MPRPIVGLVTDLGLRDDAVGICKGLILSCAPEATIIDVTHAVPPFNVREGSAYLTDSATHFPPGSVFGCVVYPETGTEMKCIAVVNEKDQIYVAPNNGLLTGVLGKSGVKAAYEITSEKFIHPRAKKSFSFYGLDVVMYAVGQLAAGLKVTDAGPQFKAENIVRLNVREPRILSNGDIEGEIALIDKNYGNVWTNIPIELLEAKGATLGVGEEVQVAFGPANAGKRAGDPPASVTMMKVTYQRTFGEVAMGKPLLYQNSRGNLAISRNQGDFATTYAIESGMSFRLARAGRSPSQFPEST